ncbi:flagellar basal body-associated FliL family protein [Thiospirillum jenense]|uniref:Flagellar protein FliL n=1 Tax=Thiospirillum jenense TaxID=1653858 RepID=A0A839HDS3_9GAMM|nr:flagellar basal body-associated FliL family protein [Thiospirillum jenense]MBB1125398.1 flagellar basal body-associated FliL family protein [Thiospirillum jenense]
MNRLINTIVSALLTMGLLFNNNLLYAAGGKEETVYPAYLTLTPTIVNLNDQNRARFLRVEIDLSIKTAEDAELIHQHMPALQDRLVVLLGGRDTKELQAPGARDALRKEVLEALRDTMMKTAGQPAVDDLYFTGFIIQ